MTNHPPARYRIVADANVEITPELQFIASSLKRVPGRAIGPDHLKEADILLVRSITAVDQQLLSGSPIKFVGSATAGLDHVDREYLRERRVAFAAAPGANANAVVEYILSVLAARGRLDAIFAGEGVGVVGYGHVGRRLVEIIAQWGGRVSVWDPWQSIPAAYRSSSLQHVMSQAVVSVHASLHQCSPWPSVDLIDEALVAGSSGNQLFINASRGGIVSRGALVKLRSVGAELALDVWPDEPRIPQPELDMVTLATPHIAGYSVQAKRAATNMLVAEITGQSPSASHRRDAELDMTDCHDLPVVDWLAALLLRNYDPTSDDRALRSKASNNGVRLESFEALRTGYSLRSELRGLKVRVGEGYPEELSALCAPLGISLQ